MVLRRRLFDRLDHAVHGRVTLLSAEAGSGKTVLLRSWLEDRPRPLAWIDVERGEDDAQRFWDGFVRAIAAGTSGVGGLAEFSPFPNFDGDLIVARLLEDLSSLEDPLVLVIDDLHELVAEGVEEQLGRLVSRLPAQHHLVLSTRRDPGLGVHRLRLRGEIEELRSQDLRFSLEDARKLLKGSGVELSDSGLAAIYERTEGWAAGVRLAALSLASDPDPDRFVADFTGRRSAVADYLVAEVLDGQPAPTRRMLRRTSILDRVSGPLADHLDGGFGSEAILQDLAEIGAFILPIEPGSEWFRYHPLLIDVLRAELLRLEPDGVQDLHAAAASWLADRGRAAEAVHHAVLAGDQDLAVTLLAGNYFSLSLDGRQDTAHHLLRSFPVGAAPADPQLAMVVAADRSTYGSLDQAAEQLALAERRADAVPIAYRNRFDATLALVGLGLARRRGDFSDVLDRFGRLDMSWEAQSAHEIDARNDIRTAALMNLGIVEVWAGRPEQGSGHLEEALALAREIDRPYLEANCLAHLAVAASRHSFARAEAASREALAIVGGHGWGDDPVVVVPALASLAAAQAYTGAFEEADRALDRAEDLLRPGVEPAVAFFLRLVRGALLQARGSLIAARDAYREAAVLEAVMVRPPRLSSQRRWATLQVGLQLDGPDAARGGMAEMTAAELDSGPAHELLARIALEESEPEEALAHLALVIDGQAPSHHPSVVIRSLVLAALAEDRLGDSRSAEDLIERALGLAEPDRLILPFAHVPSREALDRHPRHRTSHRAFLLEILDVLAGQSARPSIGAAPGPPLEELSGAELRVLRYLPSNLRAPEIAAELYISLNTMKTHTRHIYLKLGVHSRTEAVEKAREVGLLGPSARMR
jgi:LuxR family maltose regulon positive regulatory protein